MNVTQTEGVRVRALCACALARAGFGLLASPPLAGGVLAAALIDVEPLHAVAFCQNMKAAGSTNPGALNSAICPAMCSHPAAESSARQDRPPGPPGPPAPLTR